MDSSTSNSESVPGIFSDIIDYYLNTDLNSVHQIKFDIKNGKAISGLSKDFMKEAERLGQLPFFCDSDQPLELNPGRLHGICDYMKMPCNQFLHPAGCIKWIIHFIDIANRLSDLHVEIKQASNLIYHKRLLFWEQDILPILGRCDYNELVSFNDFIMPSDNLFIRFNLEDNISKVLSILPDPEEETEVRLYNGTRSKWFWNNEAKWIKDETGIDISFEGMKSVFHEKVVLPIINEYRYPADILRTKIEEHIIILGNEYDAIRVNIDDIVTLDKRKQIIHNQLVYEMMREIPDFIGFLNELYRYIQRSPEKSVPICKEMFDSQKGIGKLTKPTSEPQYLIDIWNIDDSGDKTSYHRVMKFLKTNTLFFIDKPVVAQNGAWTKFRGSTGYLAGFVKQCMENGHISDIHSSSTLRRVLMNTFNINALSSTPFKPSNLTSMDRRYIKPFLDMP